MARHTFGGVADYVIAVGDSNEAILQVGTAVTCWNMASGGTQYTDLVQTDGSTPVTSLAADATGALPPFQGPDGVAAMYLDANGGSGPRRVTTATDLGPAVASVTADLAAHEVAVNPHGTGYADLVDVTTPDVATYLAATPFVAAHRGSGAEFPEHTLAAYAAALAAGAKAIEVSVQMTADGVPVCMHDTTLDRTTDHTGALADWTFGALRQQVHVTSQGLLGAGWADQPIPTLQEVLDLLYNRCVIFLEPKDNPSVDYLETLLPAQYPGAPKSIIWKAYYQNPSFAWAKEQGFTTWGYVDADTTDAQLTTYGDNIDMWGVPISMTDDRITAVVGTDKPVMCWPVLRHSQVDRLTGLGVTGLMEACWLYLNNQPALTADNFASQVSMPGTLGYVDYDPTYALQYDGNGGAYCPKLPNFAVCMGGMKTGSDDTFTIGYSMRWDTVPASTLHSDLAFCKASDDPYEFSAANASGGYHVVFRGSGELQLYSHAAGNPNGTLLDQTATETPVAGTTMSFTIAVTATSITVTRTDTSTQYTVTSTDTTYRGRYWHLSNGSAASLDTKPVFSAITIS